MTTTSAQIRRTTAALVAATMIAVGGVAAVAPETAAAAGVSGERAYAATPVASGSSLLPRRGSA